jgi:hypothetical protein
LLAPKPGKSGSLHQNSRSFSEPPDMELDVHDER